MARFVDQYFRLIDGDRVVEERELREVHTHRTLFRTADASSILHVALGDGDVQVAEALGGLANCFGHRAVGVAVVVCTVPTTFGSDDGCCRAQQCDRGNDPNHWSCVHG